MINRDQEWIGMHCLTMKRFDVIKTIVNTDFIYRLSTVEFKLKVDFYKITIDAISPLLVGCTDGDTLFKSILCLKQLSLIQFHQSQRTVHRLQSEIVAHALCCFRVLCSRAHHRVENTVP